MWTLVSDTNNEVAGRQGEGKGRRQLSYGEIYSFSN